MLAIFFQENFGDILSWKPLFETLTRRSLTVLLWGNMKTSGSTLSGKSGNILSEKTLFETTRRPQTTSFQENFFLRQQKDFWQYSLHCNEWPWNVGAVFLKQRSLPLLACNFICSCWPDSPATMRAFLYQSATEILSYNADYYFTSSNSSAGSLSYHNNSNWALFKGTIFHFAFLLFAHYSMRLEIPLLFIWTPLNGYCQI